MVIKKLKEKEYLCTCCDDYATISISHHGSFKLFWACSPEDEEFTLCTKCAKELYSLLGKTLEA